MIVYLSAIFVCIGKCSHTSMPGTLVRTGRKSPRYSAGAFGFMSYISMCGGPPGSQMKMTAVSDSPRPLGEGLGVRVSAWSFHGTMPAAPRPPSVRAPNLRKSRRECGPEQVILFCMKNSWQAGGFDYVSVFEFRYGVNRQKRG